MKTFLITGASSGIGVSTARMAVDAGYRVVLAARSHKKLESLVEEFGGEKYAIAVPCDVRLPQDQSAMIDAALKAFGRIDVVFANAGIGESAPGVEGGDTDNWHDMILTNIYGCLLTAKFCLPEIRQNEGHLILTGSRLGRIVRKGSVYGATKWAVTALGYNLREELIGTRVRVTLLEPGLVDTPFFHEPNPDALRAEDIARAVMFAVSQPPHVDVSEMLVLPTSPQPSQSRIGMS